jgi:hypothetical protein
MVFEAKHEGGHYLKIRYEWLSADSVDLQKLDSGFMRDWTLLQIEGEEPKPVEQAAAIDPKAAAAKKAPAAPAKADPKKGPAGALEEITDNRPRIVTLTKDFGVETGPLRVTEDVAKRFADLQIKVEVIEVNRETQEEIVRDTVNLDMSCLLYPTTPNLEVMWSFDKLKPMSLHYLTLKVSSDQPLLSEFLRKKLNPLQLNLIACKDIPYKTEHRYKPIHCVVKFVDGKSFRTQDHPQ